LYFNVSRSDIATRVPSFVNKVVWCIDVSWSRQLLICIRVGVDVHGVVVCGLLAQSMPAAAKSL
jgi:hypothetical protein